MPSLYLRLAGAAAALLLVAGLAAGLYHRGYVAGEAKVRAADAKAVVTAQEAAIAQQEQDNQTAGVVIHGLQTELQGLKDHPPIPVPVPMRLCVSSARRSLSAPAQPASGAPSPATASGELPSVPAGAGAGIDIGPGVQRIAEAADVVAARDRACLAWARGISR